MGERLHPAESAAAEGAPSADGATRLDIAELIREYHASLYRYAFRLTGSVPDAEDLTQQTFLVAQGKLHQVRDASKVRGWLYAVLRSCFLKSRRKNMPLTATQAELSVDQIPQQVAAEDDVDRQRLQLAIDELPDEYRLVLLMFYFEDYSYKQIAAELEIPIGTVMSRLARAKGRMRRVLLADQRADERAADSEAASMAAANHGRHPSRHEPR
jgi:RNA polymerase sigma-70 factor (ECF subfamily)